VAQSCLELVEFIDAARHAAFFQIQIFFVGADKSLARPGRKQATATEDFDVHISYL
jgi:hypothetical protein